MDDESAFGFRKGSEERAEKKDRTWEETSGTVRQKLIPSPAKEM